jgi:SAM-dependent MidA family methyltransferase
VSALREKIEREIRERGPIPFSRYMELCLYDPEHGYYSRHAAQFGKAGDFYTSSDVHAVFGRLLARQFDEMWRVLGSPDHITLRELGPGRGLFAQDVLDWSKKKFPDFYGALLYVLDERSPTLRQRIEAVLSHHLDAGKAQLNPSASLDAGAGDHRSQAAERQKNATLGASHGSVPREKASEKRKNPASVESVDGVTPAILFANEFFDALPVEVMGSEGSLRIGSHNGRFVEIWAPPSPQELEFLDRYSIHPEPGECVEVPLQSQAHMSAAADLEGGFVVVIDYGYTREEQLAGRHRGTLKAIRQHSVSANPYQAPGEQDITADVNFTALAAVAEKHGMQVRKLITQSQFLLGIGEANEFADAFEDCRLPQEGAKVALQLKHLVTPSGMGESFHVLVASKGIDGEKAAALAGLNFSANPSRG